MEKKEMATHHEETPKAESQCRIQNTIGIVAEEALGDNLPDSYYRSWSFIGTVAVSQI
jgi:hypothetical protein